METNQRKVGRPKAPPRTGPLVLGDDRARTRVTLEISERANAELTEYTRWVEQCSGMPANEARFKTVDFALREIFRRDRVWQTKRRPSPQATATPSATVPTAPAPAEFQEVLWAAQRRAGLRRIKWHDLRHSYASILASGGMPLFLIRGLLGHSSVQMTERYAHLAASQTATYMPLLSAVAPSKPTPPGPPSGPEVGPNTLASPN
ncbi:MAG TPA: tyrosine-type recombinase/integrase [Polyangia bacterium]|nr:tyrosine-type recombinase/integrase [Polyangia bacterium]